MLNSTDHYITIRPERRDTTRRLAASATWDFGGQKAGLDRRDAKRRSYLRQPLRAFYMHLNHTMGAVGHARRAAPRRCLTPPQLVEANPQMRQSVRYRTFLRGLATLALAATASRPSRAQKPPWRHEV